MKKSIIKNLIALTFALGALVFVAGNVMADPTQPTEPGDQGGGGGTTTVKCYWRGVSHSPNLHYINCNDCKEVKNTRPDYYMEGRCTP